MRKLITVSREFGSGGRELGKRLSDALGIAYYDREIVTKIAERTTFSEKYIGEQIEKKPSSFFPITIGRSFSYAGNPMFEQNLSIYQEQSKVIREMAAKSDCVIVGRCADYILKDLNPFRIFVYADMESKMTRCKQNAETGEDLSDKKLKATIASIDKNRAKYYEFYTGNAWHDMLNYDLCINTTNTDLESIANVISNIFE